MDQPNNLVGSPMVINKLLIQEFHKFSWGKHVRIIESYYLRKVVDRLDILEHIYLSRGLHNIIRWQGILKRIFE